MLYYRLSFYLFLIPKDGQSSSIQEREKPGIRKLYAVMRVR